MSMLSLANSLLMTAVFRVSSMSCRSSEMPVGMVRTFQVANLRSGVLFWLLLSGALSDKLPSRLKSPDSLNSTPSE